ncbi:MAG: hypothetical protein EAZ89_07205, partial [Bacteroidetes bacterium]
CFTGTYNISAGGNCCLEAPTTPPNPIYTGGSTYNFITATDTNLCAGPVTIDLSFYQVLVQPPAYTGYVWSNGATGPVVTFSQPGTYSFTVSDYCHGPWSYFLTDTIVVEACCVAPPAPLLSGDTTYCQGETPTALLATAQNGGPLTWYSNAALSVVAASGNSFVPPSATGTYTFYVTESNGPCVSPARSITVNIFPNPIADAGPAQRLCEGSPGVSLSGSGGQTYAWSPAAPLSNAGIANPVATPAASTLFTLTVTDANGCSDTDTVSVTVSRRPIASAGDDLSVCEGGSVQLSASGGSQYSWSPAFGLSNSLISNPLATPLATTRYVVTVTQGGCSDTDTVNVRVEAAPQLVVGGPYEICAGESVRLQASGAASYVWSPATGLSNPAIATPVAFPALSTNYTLTAASANGCEASTSVAVSVVPVPVTRISGESEVCAWQEVRLSASGGSTYIWSTGDTDSVISFFPTADTWVYATSYNGFCEGNIDSLLVRVGQPQAAFSLPAASGYAPFTVQPVNTSTEAESWLWLYEPNQRSTEQNPELIFQAPGEYILTLIAYDNQGCSDTATQQIQVEGVALFAPSGFTPNGDSFNDLFQIASYGISGIDIRIFNRWGATVFVSTDPAFTWDGTSGGQRCPEGVYAYVIRARGENGRNYIREGSITLIR